MEKAKITQLQKDKQKTIKIEIKYHEKNIELLYAFAQGREALKDKGCTPAAEKYQRTEADKKRLNWTVNNLQTQISTLSKQIKE